MTRPVTSLPTASAQLPSPLSGEVKAAAPTSTGYPLSPDCGAGAFYSNTVATHGTVSEGAVPLSTQAPSHPYNFPPNGNGQSAADRIANAMWEIERER